MSCRSFQILTAFQGKSDVALFQTMFQTIKLFNCNLSKTENFIRIIHVITVKVGVLSITINAIPLNHSLDTLEQNLKYSFLLKS